MYRLYYDDDCPLCVAYTNWFVKFNFLKPEGRIAFSEIENEQNKNMDVDRARNEIALVNTHSNEIFYGIDSLIEILNTKIPFTKVIAKLPPVYFLLVQLYKFISYNRKVIVGDGLCTKVSCTPDFNYTYRIAFLVFASILTGFILNKYTVHLQPFLPLGSFYRELIICLGQIIFQYLMARWLVKTPNLILHYLGNMMVVSLIGSLLLVPLLLMNTLHFTIPPFVFLGYFGLVVTFMLWLHIKRVKAIPVSGILSLTWVLYRILVLVIIFGLVLFI